ncbi:preprotein translocase subunit YajC [Corynebacterium alimapuense]|uniref:Preprotein translocase subunit YajC n=1 Tax=Corynebacterium alimapuense TaxID=1576874 RepID=A0A3M8K7Q2_9CORY|nr:preprotein translocase subunit YajC [Corynebacterium alimapuense]RNE49261.1 preprotein translocase subunit YajC [Corynebacterium alimapuense]
MDFLLLLLILAVFILPSFFMMRTQRKRQAELQNMQSSLLIGDKVVTVSGIHGTVVGMSETELDIEIAAGVVVLMDRIAVLREAEPAEVAAPPMTEVDEISSQEHPENFPDAGVQETENPNRPEDNR